MRRRIPIFILAFSLLLAACATSGSDDTSTSAGDSSGSSTSTEAPAAGGDSSTPSDPGDSGSDATSTTEGSVERPPGPDAPDFTLALGEDGADSFMLSQEVKPVFMVFWAEW